MATWVEYMGAIVGLILTWMIITGLYKIIRDQGERKAFIKDLSESPFELTFTLIWIACLLIFFWGVFVPSLGSIRIYYNGSRYLELWAAAGLASLAGLLIWILIGMWKSRLPKRF